jgi:hypothetical protein
MLIQEIQANAMDLAGGELIRQKLDSDYAVLVTLNTIDSMMLELAMSPKAMRDIKSSFTLAAGTDTGTVATTSFNTDNHVVRWRRNVDDLWKIMDIVEDIEDLTRLANTGREGILFTGTLSPLTYYLSFSPSENLMAEIWGKQLAADITDLNAAPPFPPEFGLVAAYRIADFLLNQLLIIDPRNLMPFVQAQKVSLQPERRRLDYIWTSFRANIPDPQSALIPDNFNYLEEYSDVTDDVEDFTERFG